MNNTERQKIKKHLKRYGKKSKGKLNEAAEEVLFSKNRSIKDLMKGIGDESNRENRNMGIWKGGGGI